jgi:hypothetical protein
LVLFLAAVEQTKKQRLREGLIAPPLFLAMTFTVSGHGVEQGIQPAI